MSIACVPSFQTYGHQTHQHDFGAFAVSIGSHCAGHSIPQHRHADEYVWCVMLNGALEETAGARCEEAKTGSVIIRPPDCIHADRFAVRPGLCLNIFPSRRWLSEHGIEQLSDVYLHQRTRASFQLGQEIALELKSADTRTTAAVEALLLELLGRVARITNYEREGRARWLAIAMDEIEADLSGALRLSDLAKHCGVSAGHLARAFRAAHGKALGAYVRERRLRRAADLLRNSTIKLADVAATVGFCDQAHFSRAFKAEFDASPAAYRKQLQS